MQNWTNLSRVGYYFEVQRFDKRAGNSIAALEEAGEFDNTIIVMSGERDNMVPFRSNPMISRVRVEGGPRMVSLSIISGESAAVDSCAGPPHGSTNRDPPAWTGGRVLFVKVFRIE